MEPTGERKSRTAVLWIAAGLAAIGGSIVLSRFGAFLMILPIPVALVSARVASDFKRHVPGATTEDLSRRARSQVLIALPFATAALFTGLFATPASEKADVVAERILGIIIPCSFFAIWFGSGAIAPGYAWLRSRDSDEREGS